MGKVRTIQNQCYLVILFLSAISCNNQLNSTIKLQEKRTRKSMRKQWPKFVTITG